MDLNEMENSSCCTLSENVICLNYISFALRWRIGEILERLLELEFFDQYEVSISLNRKGKVHQSADSYISFAQHKHRKFYIVYTRSQIGNFTKAEIEQGMNLCTANSVSSKMENYICQYKARI